MPISLVFALQVVGCQWGLLGKKWLKVVEKGEKWSKVGNCKAISPY